MNVSWSAPDKPNGVLTKYRVLASLNGSSDSVSEATVDASSALRATLDGLTPFTVYDVRIEAFTVGGSALGEAATIKTEESGKESVSGRLMAAATDSSSFPESCISPVGQRMHETIHQLTNYNGSIIHFTQSARTQLIYLSIFITR